MTATDVVEVVGLLEGRGVEVVLDGGWGVDALLGRQTRPHADLDVAVAEGQVGALRQALGERGWSARPGGNDREESFVLVDGGGRRLDVHVWPGIPYPAESLHGAGTVAGRRVRCITAEWAVKFHCQYEPDEDDARDVRALCEAFGIDLPERYRRFH